MTFNRLCSKLILFSSLFLLGACSPKQESSTVQLKFPDWDQVRAKDLARQSKVSSLALPEAKLHLISVNVTGPGMAPLIFHWEHENGVPRPEVVQFPNVPRGNDRLVQVLAIYENEGSMAFYYGDQRLNITSDIANADVEVVNEATAQNLVEGRIAGRFLSGANDGYTGVVQLRFNPPSGAPPMVAANSELFSGWGELFALSTPLISFTRPDGSKIFEGLTNDTYSFFNAQNMIRAVRIHVPGGYENKSHSNGTYDMHPVKQQRLLVGYFGYYNNATDSLQRVCVPNPSTIGSALDVEDRYKTANAADPTQAPSNPIKWLGRHVAGRISTDHAYVEAVLPPGGTLAMGGDDTVSCSSDTSKKFTEFLDLTGTNLDHGDEMLGIRGPYGKHPDVDSNSSHVVLTEFDDAADKIVLSWKYLPGTANALAGSSVFYRSKPGYDVWDDGELRADDGFRCNALSKIGFNEIPVGQGIETAEIPNIQNSTQASGLQILLCPKGHHGLFFQGAAPAQYGSGGGVGGGGGSPATKLVLVGPDEQNDNFKFTNQTCSPIRVLAVDASDQKANYPAGALLNLSGTVGTYSFHDTPDCLGSALPLPMNMTGRFGETTLFVKRTVTGDGGATLTVSDSSGQLASKTVSTHFIDDPGANKIKLIGPPSIVAQRCYPIDFQTRYIDATPTDRIAKHGVDSIPIDLPMGSNPTFYDENDWNCAGAPVSLASAVVLGVTAGKLYVNKRLHFKYTGVGGFGIAPSTSHGLFSSNILPLNYGSGQITQPGSISTFQIMGNNQAQANSCVRMTVGFYDSNQNPALVVSGTNGGSPVTVNLGTDPGGRGTFHDNTTDCTGGINPRTSTTIPVGSTTRTVYFRPSVSNTIVRTTAASVVPAKNSSLDINVSPELPVRLAVKLSGQSLMSGFPVGPQPIIAAGVNFNIDIVAIKSDNSIDTGFNGQLTSLNGGGSFMTVSGLPMNFVGGVATATVKYNTRQGSSLISASANPNGIMGNSTSFFVEDDVTPMNLKLYQTNSNWIPNVCQPMLLTPHTNEVNLSSYIVGNSAPVVSPVQVNLSRTSGPTTYFYEDPTCGGSVVSSVTIPAGSRGMLIGVKSSGTGSMTFDASDNAASLNMTIGNPNFNAGTLSGSATMVHIIGNPNLELGACQAYAAVLIENTTGSAATLGVNENLTFSGSNMTYHTDSNCSSPPQSTFTIPAGTTSIMYYGRAIQVGQDSGVLIPTSSNGLTRQGPPPDNTLRVF